MSTILAIETSTDACSVALYHKGDVTERFEIAAKSHTRRLLPMIDELLSHKNLALTDLEAIAVTVGPGSFTGIRIGLGVAQGLAFSLDIPIIPVSSLVTIAWPLIEKNPDHHIWVIQDARMSEFYVGLVEFDGVLPLSTETLEKITEIAQPDHFNKVVGTGFELLTEQQQANLTDQLVEYNHPHAADVAKVAAIKFKQGYSVAAEKVEPTYLRNEVSWNKRIKKVDRYNAGNIS